jgi:transposase InsO family protein
LRKWKLDFLRGFVRCYPNTNKVLLCKIYKVTRSSLYYRKKQDVLDRIDETKIQVIHIFDPYYGHRRISYKLHCNKKKTQRIMQKYSIKAYSRKRRFRKPWDKNFAHMWVENFKKTTEITYIHQVWNTDFTHLYYKEKEFYLSTVLDDLGKNVVGYKIWFHHGKELILETLRDAIHKAETVPLMVHSDQGSEYRSYEYFDALRNYNIQPSMSRKSSPWENGWQESFYWKLKFELWNLNRFKTFEEVIEAIHLWIYYYNNERIHTTLKMSPKEFKEKHNQRNLSKLTVSNNRGT